MAKLKMNKWAAAKAVAQKAALHASAVAASLGGGTVRGRCGRTAHAEWSESGSAATIYLTVSDNCHDHAGGSNSTSIDLDAAQARELADLLRELAAPLSDEKES